MENTFGVNIIPANDRERLEKLYGYGMNDSFAKQGSFQHIATMASHIFNTPIALVSFVDKEKVLFKANVGMEESSEVSRGVSLCSLAILKDGVTVFQNAKDEPCLLGNPLVAGNFGLRFYAAAPIKTPDGFNIGAVCVVDKKPRTFSEADRQLLNGLASLVMDELGVQKNLKTA